MKILFYILIIILNFFNYEKTVGKSDMVTENMPDDEYIGYDFNADGNSEIIRQVEGTGIVNYIIYEPSENNLVELGTITVNNNNMTYDTLCHNNIIKYYDSKTDSYFFFCDYIQEKDEWFYYRAVKYEIIDNQLERTLISSVNGIVSFDNQLYIVTDYFNDSNLDARMIDYKDYIVLCERVEKYMEQFIEIEKIDLNQYAAGKDMEEIFARFNYAEKSLNNKNESIECFGNSIDIDSVEVSVKYDYGEEMSDLGKLNQCRNLGYLYLSNYTETHLDLSWLKDSNNLKCIWVPDNIKIESLKHLSSVEVLLGNITEQYADVLSELNNLKFVMLDADSQEENYFNFLSEYTQLEGIYLTANVSELQMNYIRKNFPNIKFIYKKY